MQNDEDQYYTGPTKPKWLARLRCWWSGCYSNPYDDECPRCGLPWQQGHGVGIRGRVSFWWNYQRPKWLRWREFFEKCPDCGKRFFRHDDSKEHIPF